LNEGHLGRFPINGDSRLNGAIPSSSTLSRPEVVFSVNFGIVWQAD
jgi:hypothetical protein